MRMTIYCYDTEFLEDGHTIDLISIGIVCEDGREYYAVNSDCDFTRIKENDWLVRKVVAHLPVDSPKSLAEYIKHPSNSYPKPSIKYLDLDRTSSKVKPKWVIANEVRDFMLAGVELTGPSIYLPELWAYYGAYDHVALAQLWGQMIALPKGIPMWTHDLMQLIEGIPDFKKPAQDGDEHNALADARWNYQLLCAARRAQEGEVEPPF